MVLNLFSEGYSYEEIARKMSAEERVLRKEKEIPVQGGPDGDHQDRS
ncbi:MAG: hypothetical protein MZV63_08320 [Marinilabiliales bacterium]|nr:hypothetical protein [Marinilabiliales bacterium]